MVLYIERWLKAPAQDEQGNQTPGTKGTPQGGVISPLLANLFLHYAFDDWMKRKHPSTPFERYADDAIVHCRSKAQAESYGRPLRSGWPNAVWSSTRRKPRSSIGRVEIWRGGGRFSRNCFRPFRFVGV